MYEFGNRLPPLFESNQLYLAAVRDLDDNEGIVAEGRGDEDEDDLSDFEDACEIGTDPCLKDTDGDGVDDNNDLVLTRRADQLLTRTGVLSSSWRPVATSGETTVPI